MREPTFKRLSSRRLQRRLIGVILLAFLFPFVCLIYFQISAQNKVQEIKRVSALTYAKSNESIKAALSTTESLFKLSALQRAQSIAQMAALVIQTRHLTEQSLATDPTLLDLIRHERIGSECQISIINAEKDRILLDKYLQPGAQISTELVTVSRLIGEKNYLAILRDATNNPALAASIGTVSEIYRTLTPPLPGEPAEQAPRAENKFAILTPIAGTPYSLAVVSLMGGLTENVMVQVEGTVSEISRTLLEIDRHSIAIAAQSRMVTMIVLVFGALVLLGVFFITRRRIVIPTAELMETADAFRDGDFERRVNLAVMTEDLMDLGGSVNRMLDEISELIESEEDKKRLQENIIRLLEIVSKAAEGDLTQRGAVNHSVLAPLLDALNMMLESFSKLVVQVKTSGRRVTLIAGSILESGRKMTLDGERQAREIQQASQMVSHASRSMQRVSVSSDQASTEAQRANSAAREGAHRVHETIQNMQRIRNNVQATAKTIKMLGDRSLEINAIVEMINDISARTNILSLNAAIEASKAGEQGKGFAVVADEIRKLAERTSSATREVSSFIEDIQIETNDAVLAMEEVTREVELGWKTSDQAGTTLHQIQDVIAGAADRILEISKVSREMVGQMDLVNERIKSILQTSRDTADGILRTGRDTRTLLKPLRTLNEAIAVFHLHPRYEQDMQIEWIMPTVEELDRDEAVFGPSGETGLAASDADEQAPGGEPTDDTPPQN